MSRYYFQVNDGRAPDAEGVELASVALAKCLAVKTAGQMVAESGGSFWDTQEFNLTVTNADGLTLFSLLFIGIDAAALRRPCL